MTLLRILIGITLVLGLLAPLASAQTSPTLSISAPDKASVSLGPNESAEIKWTLSNTGNTDGSLTLSLDKPAGWTVTISPTTPATLTRASGNSLTVTAVVSPESGKTPANGSLTLSGSL